VHRDCIGELQIFLYILINDMASLVPAKLPAKTDRVALAPVKGNGKSFQPCIVVVFIFLPVKGMWPYEAKLTVEYFYLFALPVLVIIRPDG
jgi:hypothetical protein